MSTEITDVMIAAFNNADFTGLGNADWEDSHIRVGLTAVLDMPEVRDAVYADVRREVEAKPISEEEAYRLADHYGDIAGGLRKARKAGTR